MTKIKLMISIFNKQQKLINKYNSTFLNNHLPLVHSLES